MRKHIFIWLVLLLPNFALAQETQSEPLIDVNNTANTILDSLIAGSDIDIEQLLLESINIPAETQKKIDAAFSAMEAVKKAGAYIESLQELFEDGIVTLPVGIKKGEYELIIQKMQLDSQTGKTKIYASCAFQFKEDGQPIAFDGWSTLEGQKGLGTEGCLELITPIQRKMGNKATLIFKSGSKANFGCDGIDSFFANLTLAFTSENIIPVDDMGNQSGKYLNTSIQTSFSDFDNYTLSFSFNKHFMFKAAKDLVFSLKGGVLDQSDTQTPTMVSFPDNYFSLENPEEKNLWKGLSFSSASVSLPAIFKKPTDSTQTDTLQLTGIDNRITIAVNNLINDENGLSGHILAQDVLSSNELNPSDWAISIADFSCELLKDEVVGIGFGGDMNLPPLGENSLLPYSASYNHSEDEYQFQVGIQGDYDFPVLCSSLSLNQNSFIEVLIRDNNFYPSLYASGYLSIDAPIGSNSENKFNLPDIAFQEMCISREAPYFSVGALGLNGNLTMPQIAGFGLSINDINSFTDSLSSGLSFTTDVQLSSVFSGDADMKLYGDYSQWKFNKLAVDRINVDFKSGAYSVKGGVWFKDGDAIYGKGFRGDVTFTIIDKFNLDAVAVFGKKDDYRYFLTDVFTELSPSSGIPLPPALTFYGFGGGLYSKMQQSADNSMETEFGQSLSGINYVPDNTVGMGFMAATKFALVGSSSAFNAKVGLEMQFNQYGGLNFIQLRGDGAFMNSPDAWGSLADNINEAAEKIEAQKGKLTLATKSDLKVPENKSSGFLTASLNIKYDLANSVFSADMATYLNAGFIKGVGENDKMGWASAYFAPDKWYTYIGTPSDRLGIEVLNLARADGYFMIGDDIPELPAPPEQVLQNFSLEKRAQLEQRDNQALTQGNGLAFGSSLGVNFDATLVPFYARFGVGLGAEFLLKNYGVNAYCAGSTTTLGINGWYARAQAWAWVEAGIGMEAKLFGSTRRFEILDLSASALLAGAGPNPFYFTGAVGGRFNVMGGLVSGQCDFDFEIGEECQIMGGSPFGEEVISQITPAEGENEVNVFAAPQALFNIPVGLEMEVEEGDGQMAWYKVTLEEFSVTYKDEKQVIDGHTELSNDGKLYVLDPNDPFLSNSNLMVTARVGFKRKLNGEWIYVRDENNNILYETKSADFTSGERPKSILPEHVAYSYPLNRQYNYFPDEYNQGYIMLSENYEYLFTTDKPEGCDQVLRVSDTQNLQQTTSFSYQNFGAGNAIRLEITYNTENINWLNSTIYSLELVNIPQEEIDMDDNITDSQSNLGDNDQLTVNKQEAEGTLDLLEETNIYSINFKTSQYNTFLDKMNHFSLSEAMTWPDGLGTDKVVANVYEDAPSGAAEVMDNIESNKLLREHSLVQFTPVYSGTDWYVKDIAPLIYENSDLLEAVNKTDLTPPQDAEAIYCTFISATELSDDAMEGITSYVYPGGALHYRVPRLVDKDFSQLQTDLANTILSQAERTKDITNFLATDLTPEPSKGTYEFEISYHLPGKEQVTSSVKRAVQL